jgi:hypothetical protein
MPILLLLEILFCLNAKATVPRWCLVLVSQMVAFEKGSTSFLAPSEVLVENEKVEPAIKALLFRYQ